MDGANGIGGEKMEVLKKMLDCLPIEVRNSGKGGGILNEGVGADYVQKEKVVPQGFGFKDVGIRSGISFFDSVVVNHANYFLCLLALVSGMPALYSMLDKE